MLALCPSGQFWGLCKVPHDNLVCWEIGEYKSCRELMYLAPVKIWWYLALWFVSYACLKLGFEMAALCFV